ncbi:uncharacterized protein LOC110445154 isoform X1 [Mizuhopecten yessoensis]|uniref:Uncharacterized protein n=2 Tax=Mizuhopecten yessoensis TaxID=6573 RepID=A0A210R0G6_MIZYE|nr:uncharacterized protein LOC110445154 isoform X1 [Mizuhopecten yessoensis]OWF54405.1 hypothetical protein KP79_PYT08622 [Mizuhopecten yessoensis]
MSMDFKKFTYRPSRPDNRFRTNYALMSQWMAQPTRGTRADMEIQSAVYGKKVARSQNPYMDQSSPRGYAQAAAIEEGAPPHMRFAEDAGYDDFHKAFRAISKQWPNKSHPNFGPPRLRMGRAGGSWRHVKEVLQAGGARIVFVDGQRRNEDTINMDIVPGGHLVQNVVPRVDGANARLHGIGSGGMTSMHREKNASNRINGTSAYGLETRQGLEQNNWCVMR